MALLNLRVMTAQPPSRLIPLHASSVEAKQNKTKTILHTSFFIFWSVCKVIFFTFFLLEVVVSVYVVVNVTVQAVEEIEVEDVSSNSLQEIYSRRLIRVAS